MSFDISELTDLAADLAGAAASVTVSAALDVATVGRTILEDAEASAPVLTGLLASSYSMQVEGLRVTVGNDAEYADEVEYGTSDTPAQPSLGPAFDRHQASLGDSAVDTALQALR